MQARTRKTIYWPGINNHIKNIRATCQSCSYNTPSQPKETLMVSQHPVWPIQKIKISSARCPQSNGWVEAAVKTVKRIIRENTTTDGLLNTDKIAKAITQYQKPPLPGIFLSPSQVLFHKELHDFTPNNPTHYPLYKD